MDKHMLTTTDNPFSPIDQYDAWLTWDMSHGYHTNALLARVAVSSVDLSDADRAQSIEDAITEIVENNLSGVHTKVLLSTKDTAQTAS